MPKHDLKQRVFKAADDLFIQRGTLQGIGYREIRERARGASNDVMQFVDDWRLSRGEMMNDRPEGLTAIADEFAGRLWLLARLLAARSEIDAAIPSEAGIVRSSPTRPAPLPAPAATYAHKPIDAIATQRSVKRPDAASFSEIARPERHTKPDPKAAEKRRQKHKRSLIIKSGGKAFVLVPARTKVAPRVLSAFDWTGAKNVPLAKAVATVLRKKADRMRAKDIFRKLPPSLRPGTAPHAQRDLKNELQGCRMEWSPGGWFWFRDEPLPIHRDRLDTSKAKERHKAAGLWWRIAHTIAELDRPFEMKEIQNACESQLAALGGRWLGVRLIRARDRNPPFVRSVAPGVFEWTGLDPSEVVLD